jgi:hypothetical protein
MKSASVIAVLLTLGSPLRAQDIIRATPGTIACGFTVPDTTPGTMFRIQVNGPNDWLLVRQVLCLVIVDSAAPPPDTTPRPPAYTAKPLPPPADPTPTGWLEVFRDDFETGRLNTARNGYRWGESRGHPGELPVITDELAHSGRNSLKFTFIGSPDPRDDAWSEQRFVLGDSLKDVTIEWYQYYPDGRDGHGAKYVHRRAQGPTNNKLLSLWSEDYQRYGVAALLETEGAGPDPTVVNKFGARGGRGVGNYGTPVWRSGITDGYRGRWIRYRRRVKVASSAMARDGISQLWVDDALVIDARNLPLYPRDGGGAYIRYGYLMGWANTGFDRTTYTYIDDVTISVPTR